MRQAPAVPAALRHVAATRYVAPLREGGSLPGLVEADDDGLYVVKFRGAGQGAAALVAEVVAGELARALGLLVPDLVVAEIAPELALAEPDPEIKDLVTGSAGDNLGVDFLPGALPFTPAGVESIDPGVAADVVWLDALVMNVDRTPRNPNLLVWHGRTWLIDHGAALYRQHGPAPLAASARAPFPHVADHVLLACAGPIPAADARLAPRALAAVDAAVGAVPDGWLGDDPVARRADVAAFLRGRLQEPRGFAEEAEDARP
jgi:HipA-like protein